MSITVRAGRIPGRIEEYMVPENSTVNDVLGTAGLDPTGQEARIDGREVQLGEVVQDGQTLLLVRKIKGNVVVRLARKIRSLFVRNG